MKLTKINKNFQLLGSTKNSLKISEEKIVQGIQLFATTASHTLLLGLKITKSAKYIFQVQVMFVLARYNSFYIYINTILKTNTVVHNVGPQGYPLLSINVGVSPFYGLIVASPRINQTFIKIDKVKIKPYLQQKHSIG